VGGNFSESPRAGLVASKISAPGQRTVPKHVDTEWEK
jgi:hypothetical protein